MEVQVKDLNFQAAGKKILRHISLKGGGQQMIGILGPNGSGKTTLLKHIYRESPSAGKVFFNDVDIASLTRKALAQKISVLTQHMEHIDQSLTVREIVGMGRYPYKSFFQRYDETDAAITEEVLKRNGLQDLYNRTLDSMSGGEIQRTMLAKALAQQPEVLILDEPTNHMDIKYRFELMNQLKSFQGLVLITMHDLYLAANYCDYLYVLKDGRLRGEGPPETLFTNEFLSEVFEVPFKVMRVPELIIYSPGH